MDGDGRYVARHFTTLSPNSYLNPRFIYQPSCRLLIARHAPEPRSTLSISHPQKYCAPSERITDGAQPNRAGRNRSKEVLPRVPVRIAGPRTHRSQHIRVTEPAATIQKLLQDLIHFIFPLLVIVVT